MWKDLMESSTMFSIILALSDLSFCLRINLSASARAFLCRNNTARVSGPSDRKFRDKKLSSLSWLSSLS